MGWQPAATPTAELVPGSTPLSPRLPAAQCTPSPPCTGTDIFQPNLGCRSDGSRDRRDGGGGSAEPEPTVLWGVEDCGGPEVPGEGGPVGRRGSSSGGEGGQPAAGRQCSGCAGEIQQGGFLEGREKRLLATCTLSQVGFTPPRTATSDKLPILIAL